MGQQTVKTWMGTFAAIALSGGLTIGCSRSLPDQAADKASPTAPSPENTLTTYARAVLEIEPLRTQAYDKISAGNAESSQPPAVVCNDRNTVVALRGEVKKIAVDYCNEAKEIVVKHGLTPAKFNEITEQLKNDPQLKEAIKNEFINRQKLTQPTS